MRLIEGIGFETLSLFLLNNTNMLKEIKYEERGLNGFRYFTTTIAGYNFLIVWCYYKDKLIAKFTNRSQK